MNNFSYTASIEHMKDESEIKCDCQGCDWTGTADKLEDIEDAILTPGDPSPAGRCPECDSLAYVIDDKQRAYHLLHDMLSDMIESGRLRQEDIPDDYQALVQQLERLAN